MKLRLQGNTLRLRLSQSEVARLAQTGVVRETVAFASGEKLEYTLESGEAVSATFRDCGIRVVLPSAQVSRWIASDQVGIEDTDGPLAILVEKDFQCLHQPSPEDADAFPNPLGRAS